MVSVSAQEAETNFKEILDTVLKGEDVMILSNGSPVAKLTAVLRTTGQRIPDLAKGLIWISPDFDEPLSNYELEQFQK